MHLLSLDSCMLFFASSICKQAETEASWKTAYNMTEKAVKSVERSSAMEPCGKGQDRQRHFQITETESSGKVWQRCCSDEARVRFMLVKCTTLHRNLGSCGKVTCGSQITVVPHLTVPFKSSVKTIAKFWRTLTIFCNMLCLSTQRQSPHSCSSTIAHVHINSTCAFQRNLLRRRWGIADGGLRKENSGTDIQLPSPMSAEPQS